jgi:Domain of unknown function (DUF6250)
MGSIGMKTVCVVLLYLGMTTAWGQDKNPDPRYTIDARLYSDDFADLKQWSAELEKGGSVTVKDGTLDIDVPAGCTVWFRPFLRGPVMVQYQATVISAGGDNDRVSDLNCFWMARDSRSPDDIFDQKRSGKFSDYDQLLTYYVGLGGNGNTTTRFRRYVGQKDNRPLLPENDLREKSDLIVANKPETLRLIACGNLIQYWRDDKSLFEMNDPSPYTSGWFGLRTTKNHMKIKDFRVFALRPTPSP